MTSLRLHPACAKALYAAVALALGATHGATHAQKKPLNDTGATKCFVNSELTTACTGTGQDGEFGRDVTKKNKDDGFRGFSYVKVCNSGELAGTGACPIAPTLGSGANRWGCTQDNVTKLVWEVKTNDGGLHDWRNIYSNLGNGQVSDSSEFVASVNAQGLCGAHDWKLPTTAQLQDLVNFGVGWPGPTIDKSWFPNTASGFDQPNNYLYATSDSLAGDESSVWMVNFSSGGFYLSNWGHYVSVRLVRVGQ